MVKEKKNKQLILGFGQLLEGAIIVYPKWNNIPP